MDDPFETKKKRFKVPHSFIIILCIILFAVALTWVVPAGKFKRAKNDLGISVVNPSSFALAERSPVSPLAIPEHIVSGLVKSADLFFLIILAGGAFSIIAASGTLQSLIGKAAKKFAGKEIFFIPALTLVFGLIATTQGVNMFIAFAPMMVLIARAMGYDSIVGAGIILLGGAVGFSTGTLNPNTTIVAQKLAELPLYSGIEYRAVCFVVFMVVTDVILVRYARKVRKDPTLSPMFDLDSLDGNGGTADLEAFGPMDARKWLVLAALAATLGIIVYGGIALDWDLAQNSAAFLWLAAAAGAAAGFGPSKIASTFVDGSKKMISAALIIGLARAVPSVLAAGGIIDTIVHGLGSALGAVPRFAQGIAMLLANNVINLFIVSGSGQAAATMPILVPLSDLVGITRQTMILTYNFGDGFSNYILPHSTALMGILGAANIPYDRWMKFMGRTFLIWLSTGSVLVVIAQVINLGPL